MPAGRQWLELEDRSLASVRDSPSGDGQLLVPDAEVGRGPAAGRNLLQEGVPLLQDPPVQGEISSVPGLHLNQHLVEKAPPVLWAGLDQAQVFRPEENRHQVAGQVDRPARLIVDPDRPPRPFAFDTDRDRDPELTPRRLRRLDGGLHPSLGRHGPDHLRLPPSTRRRGESDHGDRFQEVGLPLGVLAQEDVQTWAELEVELAVVPEVAQTEVGDAHTATTSPPAPA